MGRANAKPIGVNLAYFFLVGGKPCPLDFLLVGAISSSRPFVICRDQEVAPTGRENSALTTRTYRHLISWVFSTRNFFKLTPMGRANAKPIGVNLAYFFLVGGLSKPD